MCSEADSYASWQFSGGTSGLLVTATELVREGVVIVVVTVVVVEVVLGVRDMEMVVRVKFVYDGTVNTDDGVCQGCS